MKFKEIPLFRAVHRIYPDIERRRGDAWLRDTNKRRELYREVINAFLNFGYEDGFPWSLEAVLVAWATYGKQSKLVPGTEVTKIGLICDLYEKHDQKRCFYEGRHSVPCDDEATVDRIRPASKGGEYTVQNCVLACSKHNTARSDKRISDFVNEE
ncbi:MAG: HNH endonuclease [Phycisphaerae bacterium]